MVAELLDSSGTRQLLHQMFSKIILPILLVLGAAVLTGLLVANRPEAAQESVAPVPLLVSSIIAKREAVTHRVDSQGEVKPRTETTLMSEVSGQIQAVSPAFVAGGYFKAGDVLLSIDPRNYETQVKRARANVAKARTQIATENALAGYAVEDWERLRALRATAKNASDLTLRRPQLAQAIAELESSEADLAKAEADLARATIRAPYAGMVRNKRADVGQFVGTGAPLAEIFAVDYAEVRLPLTQNDLDFIDVPKPGNESLASEVTLSATIGQTRQSWPAELVRTEGVFDASTRVLYGVARVEDPYALNEAENREPLRIGTFVTAQVTGRDGGLLFVVPRVALSGTDRLWLIDKEDRLQAAQVSIVRRLDDHLYIKDGLHDGDRICLTPLPSATAGMLVRVRDV